MHRGFPAALVVVASILAAFLPPAASGQTITRAEVLEVARSFAEHRWTATEANVRHGLDSRKIPVQTPNRSADMPNANPDLWVSGTENVGMPYKWGGFDSLQSFTAGIRAGKAAGDLYNAEKRRKGDAAVSGDAVGIDCSGFISRCWKLRKKYGTATLREVSKPLRSPAELLPGDIMNTVGGHVILFAEWSDAAKTRARFYEAEPFSKVIASEYEIASLVSSGFQPLRFQNIRN